MDGRIVLAATEFQAAARRIQAGCDFLVQAGASFQHVRPLKEVAVRLADFALQLLERARRQR